MPITINGNTVTTNSVNGTAISSETVNGTQVYGGTTTKQWVYITYESSEPTYRYYAYATSDATREDWVDALESLYPAKDLAVGTMGYVIVQGDTMYPILQVQEV